MAAIDRFSALFLQRQVSMPPPYVLEPTPENVEEVADCIRDGGLVVVPTDTHFSIAVDPWYATAIERVYEITGRAQQTPLSVGIRDPRAWSTYGRHDDPDLVRSVIEHFWPGPLRIDLDRTNRVQDGRLTRDGAVRLASVSNPVWRDVTRYVDGPVAMTPARRAGVPAADTLVDIRTAMSHVGDDVDYVLAGDPQGTTQSPTVLDLTGNPHLRREGDVTRDHLAAEIEAFR
jgi:tRNA threonylcarbamoyl adenosine modification protein (Sua5/YciO/YrdC/YwlC family)